MIPLSSVFNRFRVLGSSSSQRKDNDLLKKLPGGMAGDDRRNFTHLDPSSLEIKPGGGVIRDPVSLEEKLATFKNQTASLLGRPERLVGQPKRKKPSQAIKKPASGKIWIKKISYKYFFACFASVFSGSFAF